MGRLEVGACGGGGGGVKEKKRLGSCVCRGRGKSEGEVG